MTATPATASAAIIDGGAVQRGRKWSAIDVLLLVVALGVSSWVLSTHIRPSPSFDELWHLMISAGRGTPAGYFPRDVVIVAPPHLTTLIDAPPAWKIWTTLDGMPHPPLYFVVLRAWRALFGESEMTARGLSIACTLAAVTFVFLAGRLAMNGLAALPAALVLGCAQTQVYLAHEIRPYALAIALTAAALYAMTRIDVLGPTRRQAIALAGLTLPLMLTHYFAFGICVAIAAFGFIRLRGQRRAFAIALLAAGAIFGTAWAPFALPQARDAGSAAIYLHVDHVDLLSEIALLACAPFRLIADRDYTMERLSLLSGVLFVLPWLLKRRAPALAGWGGVLCGAIVSIFVLDLLGRREQLSVIRYAALGSPAVALAFVGCAWAVDHRLAYLTGATLLATGAIYLYSGNQIGSDCPSFAGAIHTLEAHVAPDEALLFYAADAPPFYPDMLALTASHAKSLFPRPIMILTHPVSDAESARLPRRVWLVSGVLKDETAQALLPGSHLFSNVKSEMGLSLVELKKPDATTQPATARATP